MRRNIDGTCSGDPCCKPRSIRTINTMNPDDSGNFMIRGDQGIHVTVGTNEIIISGIAVYYDNLDGNLVIDNDAMTIDLAEDIVIAGDLTVNGTYYTVHAEHVYTQDDYIIMRDGAVTGLGSGQFSGFQVKLYDGVNDGRLVIDNSGTARVGDVGDEQPLLTRSESGSLTNDHLLKWDGTNQKAIDAGTSISGLQPKITPSFTQPATNIEVFQYDKVITVSILGVYLSVGNNQTLLADGVLPTHSGGNVHQTILDPGGKQALLFITPDGGLKINIYTGPGTFYGSVTYIST